MYRISVDTGGTFTDVVVTADDGTVTIGKALTTPGRSFGGLSAAIANAAEQLGTSLTGLLANSAVLIYGTTRATNAIVERKTARTALLVTRGFPDTLLYRYGGKTGPLDIGWDFAPPYVPKHLTFEVPERIDAEGQVVEPLDLLALDDILARLKLQNIEAVAVSLLWSMKNPAHERAVGIRVAEALPHVALTLSHELSPTIREYPRTSATAIDASLKPLMQGHLAALKADLATAGFGGELLISASSGGVMSVDDVSARPIYMARSGPAMAPLAGIAYSDAEGYKRDIIIVDTGGTTFDVSLIRGGEIKYTRDTWLGPRYTSTLLGIATVDIRSVGAGGGSIAWLDAGGLLRVGPRSAGAVPGPACYGGGGNEPTVTDAAVVLNYIDPDRFLGGRMTLDAAAARRVVSDLAGRLGKSTDETAAAVLTLASETMIKAIEDITVNDGVNPAESVMVAGGGAAGLNILQIARSLNCRAVIVPKAAGAISASGAQHSDVAIDFSATLEVSTDAFDGAAVRIMLDRLEELGDTYVRRLEPLGIKTFSRRLFVEARYRGQQWELEIALPDDWVDKPPDSAILKATFDRTHRRLYSVERSDTAVETVNWRLRLVAHLPRPILGWKPDSAATPGDRVAEAYFAPAGIQPTHVFDGTTLPTGACIAGPAIIEEPTTTIVIPPGMTGRLAASGSFIFDLGEP
jgi:N-methylhydantoinase A